MKEYNYLLGIKCSDKLRVKLDCGLKISHETYRQSDALITTDWRGLCMLHSENGLCAIQEELGESSLPEVCRLYPRNTKQLIELRKSTCSNSCEKVVELLMDLKEPLRFEEKDLCANPEFELNISPLQYERSKTSISMIQNRDLPLPSRFIALGNAFYGTDLFSKRPDNLSYAFQVLNVFDKYYESSNSISDYFKSSQIYFGIVGKEKLSSEDLIIITERYIFASKHLEAILPDWEILFEQLIVNHMFYNDFPYADTLAEVKDAYLSLVTMYSFLRFHILGYMSDKTNLINLVDFLAAMYRLIEHSNFRQTAVGLFKNEIYPEQDCLEQLLYI
jgi:hypothetical protein